MRQLRFVGLFGFICVLPTSMAFVGRLPNEPERFNNGQTQPSQNPNPLDDWGSTQIRASSQKISTIPAVLDPRRVNVVRLVDGVDPPRQPAISKYSQSRVHYYPFAAMMQGSANYIAHHSGKTVVMHIPGDLIDNDQHESLLQDIGLCWLLGMKLVIVISGKDQHESFRHVEEEVGYLRTEMERKLNRCLRVHAGTTFYHPSTAPPEGNVVSGNNFCTAQRYSPDSYRGDATEIHTCKIEQVLNNNDVVLLTSVALSVTGEDWVQVQGPQLAARVAKSLEATKLVFMAKEPSVFEYEQVHLQDIPLSLGQEILESRDENDTACELMTHLRWSTWALERDVNRAHIVNANDGALLEELFTAQNGKNTCLYHDDEQFLRASEMVDGDWQDDDDDNLIDE